MLVERIGRIERHFDHREAGVDQRARRSPRPRRVARRAGSRPAGSAPRRRRRRFGYGSCDQSPICGDAGDEGGMAVDQARGAAAVPRSPPHRARRAPDRRGYGRVVPARNRRARDVAADQQAAGIGRRHRHRRAGRAASPRAMPNSDRRQRRARALRPRRRERRRQRSLRRPSASASRLCVRSMREQLAGHRGA